MKKFLSLFAVVAAAFCASANAQEFTNVEQIKADGKYVDAFAVQGEYVSDFKGGTAFQVIARGADKFEVVGYQNGLPGDGWDRSMARFYGEGELVDGKLVVTGVKMNIPRKGDEADVIFNDAQKEAKLIGTMEDGKFFLEFKGQKSELKKVERKSDTLGKKAPEGALVLFDGKDCGQFAGDFHMSDAQENAFWSEARFKPFERGKAYKLHIEFLLSFMPNALGQARSNSGVYIQEEYECQVLDSFGLNGENNECGGFYQQLIPEVNMCFSPLTWQTYDFEVTPAKYEDGKKVANTHIVVYHNGVKIHDAELAHETPGGKNEKDEATETTGRGLYLQGHGNKVQYRNIWLQYQD